MAGAGLADIVTASVLRWEIYPGHNVTVSM